MSANTPNGMRCFLLTVLKLINEGKKESCTFIEESISNGVASVLYEKYHPAFDKTRADPTFLKEIDSYFEKNWDDRKELYACEEQDGLALLIALVLNEICL